MVQTQHVVMTATIQAACFAINSNEKLFVQDKVGPIKLHEQYPEMHRLDFSITNSIHKHSSF